MGNERRSHERQSVDHPMVYTAIDSEGSIQTQGVGRVLDISSNGLMMETHAPISEKRLRMRITLSGGRSIAVDGVLIYSMPHRPETYRTGVRFEASIETVSDIMAELNCHHPKANGP